MAQGLSCDRRMGYVTIGQLNREANAGQKRAMPLVGTFAIFAVRERSPFTSVKPKQAALILAVAVPQFATTADGNGQAPTRASYSRRHVIAPHCVSLANIKGVSRSVSRSTFTQKMASLYQMLTAKTDPGQAPRFALRASRGAATPDRRAKRVRRSVLAKTDGPVRASHGAAMPDRKAKRVRRSLLAKTSHLRFGTAVGAVIAPATVCA
jgi:hypothetical protein